MFLALDSLDRSFTDDERVVVERYLRGVLDAFDAVLDGHGDDGHDGGPVLHLDAQATLLDAARQPDVTGGVEHGVGDHLGDEQRGGVARCGRREHDVHRHRVARRRPKQGLEPGEARGGERRLALAL